MFSKDEIEEKVQAILNTFFKPVRMTRIVCYSNTEQKVTYLEFGVVMEEISLRMKVTKYYVEITSLIIPSEVRLSTAQNVMNDIVHVISCLGVVQLSLLD